MIAVLVFVLLSVGLLLGKLARIFFPLLRRYFIPSSIVGGLVALIGGPEVWGRIVPGQPGVGRRGSLRILCPDSGLPDQHCVRRVVSREIDSAPAGSLAASGSAGGVWTGDGLGNVRCRHWSHDGPANSALRCPSCVRNAAGDRLRGRSRDGGRIGLHLSVGRLGGGTDLALGVATVGVVMGVVIGMLLINWGVRYNQTAFLTPDGFRQPEESEGTSDTSEESGGEETSKGKDVARRSDKSGAVGSDDALG
jgi:glutamate:Na+ symporter, ESS family